MSWDDEFCATRQTVFDKAQFFEFNYFATNPL